MPTEALSVALTVLGGSLVFGGIWWSIRLRLRIHTRGGRSFSVSFDVATSPPSRGDEPSMGDVPGT